MPERWVVNASPLIVLAKIDRLDLLVQQADELLVPQAVVNEMGVSKMSWRHDEIW